MMRMQSKIISSPDAYQTYEKTSHTEAELLSLVRAGDEQACERFVRQHSGRMLAVAQRFLPCEHDAADAVQDAFACAFNAIDSFEENSKLSTWLHRIVVNSCLMKLRSQRSRPEVPIDDLLPMFDESGRHADAVRSWKDDVCEQVSMAETREQVRACIDKLPASYRTILVLRDIEGHDTDETACLLGCSIANVKTRLHRARQALRTLLDPLFWETRVCDDATSCS